MLLQKFEDEFSAQRSPQRYRYLGKVGSGGMADVYLGIERGERDFSKLVAIKRLHAAAFKAKAVDPVRLFVDEARVVATLNHPHIVKVYDLLPHNSDVLILMEYVDGETLQTIMADTVRAHLQIPLPIICRWIADAAEALHYAHNAASFEGDPLHLVHRDIDMRNIMVDANGFLKIIDFGVAQTVTRHGEKSDDLGFMGKVSYAAPELFTKPESADHRVDLYALGLVLYALSTQRKPYPAKSAPSAEALVRMVIDEPLLRPTAVNHALPPEIDELICKAIHKDPNERFQNGEEFAQAVEQFAKSHDGLATPQEIKWWYQRNFLERMERHKAFVQEAMQRAKRFVQQDHVAEEEPERESLTPSLALESPSAMFAFETEEDIDEKATALYPRGPFHPARRRKYAIGAVAVFAMVAVGLGLALFWGFRSTAAKVNALPVPAAPSPPVTNNAPKKPVAARPEPSPPLPIAEISVEAVESDAPILTTPASTTPPKTPRSRRKKSKREPPVPFLPETTSASGEIDATKKGARVMTGYDNPTAASSVAAPDSRKKIRRIRVLDSYE